MVAILFLIGRLIVGGYHRASNHSFQRKALAGYARPKGTAAPGLSVLASGLLLAIGGLSLITGFLPSVGILALVLFFLPVTFLMHNFWKVRDPMARMAEMVNFTKNMALMGSALMFLAIPQPWPFSLS